MAQPAAPVDEAFLQKVFQQVDKDRSNAINASELQSCLSNGTWEPFNAETVKLMVTMFDRSHKGQLNYDEFKQLWKYIEDWRQCFQSFDRDKSGYINKDELKMALTTFGYQLGDSFYDLLLSKFVKGGQDDNGGISSPRHGLEGMPVTDDIKPNDDLGGPSTTDYKQKYSSMKNKLKSILYENELFQDELRKLQKELLDIYRDKESLLEKVIQCEDFDSSSSESEGQSSDIERDGLPTKATTTTTTTTTNIINNNNNTTASAINNPNDKVGAPKPKAPRRSRAKATTKSTAPKTPRNNPAKNRKLITPDQPQQPKLQIQLQHPSTVATNQESKILEQNHDVVVVASNSSGNPMHSQQSQQISQVVTMPIGPQPVQPIHVLNNISRPQTSIGLNGVVPKVTLSNTSIKTPSVAAITASTTAVAAKPKAANRSRAKTNNNGTNTKTTASRVTKSSSTKNRKPATQTQQQPAAVQSQPQPLQPKLQIQLQQPTHQQQRPINNQKSEVFDQQQQHQQQSYNIVTADNSGNLMHSQQSQQISQVVTMHQAPQTIHVLNHNNLPQTTTGHQIMMSNGHMISHQTAQMMDETSGAPMTHDCSTPQEVIQVINGHIHNTHHMTTQSNQAFEQQGYAIVTSNSSGNLMHPQQQPPQPQQLTQVVTMHQGAPQTIHVLNQGNHHAHQMINQACPTPQDVMQTMNGLQHPQQNHLHHQQQQQQQQLHHQQHPQHQQHHGIHVQQQQQQILHGGESSRPNSSSNHLSEQNLQDLNQNHNTNNNNANNPLQQQSQHLANNTNNIGNNHNNNNNTQAITFGGHHSMTTEQLSAEELEQHLESRRMEQAALLMPDWDSGVPSEIFSADSAIKFMAED